MRIPPGYIPGQLRGLADDWDTDTPLPDLAAPGSNWQQQFLTAASQPLLPGESVTVSYDAGTANPNVAQAVGIASPANIQGSTGPTASNMTLGIGVLAAAFLLLNK